MRSLLVAFLCFLLACTKAVTTPPTVNVTPTVHTTIQTSAGQTETKEEQQAADDEEKAQLEKLPDYAAKPVLKGEPSPEDGILFSPRQAAEAALDAAEAYKLTVENKVISNTREKELSLLEAHIKKQDEELAQCRKKSWWDKHGGATLVGIGVLAGVGMSLAVFKISARIATSEE